MTMQNSTTSVAIVGAGPTGLLLAGDLAQAGVDVTVLERRDTESNLTRAFGVHARTLEHLDARGLADELLGEGARVARLSLFDHIRIDLSTMPTRFPFLLITPQYNVEQLLEKRASAAGARIVRGAGVTALRQDADGVELTVDGATVRADYAVGADGVHSAVREALGLPFPGKSVLTSIMLADVRLAHAPPDVLAVNAVGDAFAFVAPFGDGWHRIFAWDRRHPLPDTAPVTLDEIREVTRRSLGTDFGLQEARWMSRFHSDERQAPHYRVGRVFLAGDAAHVHSPAGGQGMNTGLQDAANLGWKLAAAVQGWAPDGLLDTYEGERHPVGQARAAQQRRDHPHGDGPVAGRAAGPQRPRRRRSAPPAGRAQGCGHPLRHRDRLPARTPGRRRPAARLAAAVRGAARRQARPAGARRGRAAAARDARPGRARAPG